MESSIVVSGFGGQGVLFAGQLLAYAGMESGRYVTWIPSYGPEMRGGTAHCTVIISDEPIGAPIVARPAVALVLNRPSFDKYELLVRSGGLLVINSSLIAATTAREDIDVVYVAANDIAAEEGAPKLVNMAMLGGLLSRRPLLPLATVEQVLARRLVGEKEHLLDVNRRILHRAYQLAGARSATRPQPDRVEAGRDGE